MPTVELVDGRVINLVRSGPRGRPLVVLMHAFGLDLTWWAEQFAALGTEHDVVAFDLPGHGLSGPLDAPPSFDGLADVVAGVLGSLDAGPVHLVGLSLSGMIAQTLAIRRPELVRSLTLVATLCTLPEAGRAALRERGRLARRSGMAAIVPLSQERWFPPAFRTRRPDVLDRAGKCLMQQDPAFHAAVWEMIAELDLTAGLRGVSVPALIVAGCEDPSAPVAAAREIAGLIAGAELHAIPGVGHFPPVETPDIFNGLLLDFLARASRATRTS